MASTRAGLLQAQSHTTLQRDTLPDVESGRLIWNSDETKLQVYSGTAWLGFDSSGSGIDASTLFGEIDGGTY